MELVQINTLKDFSEIFAKDVFPFYKKHEDTFDVDGIHGVLHIGRSLIASYILSKKLIEFGAPSNTTNILIATAFHDSGRQSGGMDLWENVSAQNCEYFLERKSIDGINYTETSPKEVASFILKKKWLDSDYLSKENVLDFMCVHDSDVLEIMRPSTGRGGRTAFMNDRLLLYKNDYNFYQYYGKLINEWSDFILHTEEIKKSLSTPDCIDKLLVLIKEKKDKFPIIYKAVIHQINYE